MRRKTEKIVYDPKGVDEVLRYHREKAFKKIPSKDLIPVFHTGNSRESAIELDRMEKHFMGEEFLFCKSRVCPGCALRYEEKSGGRTPSVPFAITSRIVEKAKPFTRHFIWVKRVAEFEY
jgi:hypothetical protein